MTSGAIAQRLLFTDDAMSHGPGNDLDAQFGVGHARIFLKESANDRDFFRSVIDRLRQVDDAILVSERLEDLRAVRKLAFGGMPGIKSILYLPCENRPSFGLIKPVHARDQVGRPDLLVVLFVGRRYVGRQIASDLGFGVDNRSFDPSERNAAAAGIHDKAPVVTAISPEMDGGDMAGLTSEGTKVSRFVGEKGVNL